MFIRILCLLFICCAVALCASVEDQRKALQDLYEATNGNEWKNNTNWMRTEDYCSWYGVRCKTRSKNVNWIELDSNSLRGTIPSSISLLESLETLILSHNQLTGSIPESISQLKQFSSLNLNDNQMTGTLPASIGQIPYLVVAYFGSNQLSGTIPESFGNLTIMYGLNLTDNQISGTVPSFFSQLTGLHMLKLGHNKLTGVDPNLNLSKGISCDLSDNPMSCPIPKWVFSQCSGQCVTATPPIQSPRAAGPVHEPVTHSPLVANAPTSNVKAPITTDASLDHTLLPLVIVLAVVVVVLIGVGIALVVRMKRREADPERKQLLGDEYIRIEE